MSRCITSSVSVTGFWVIRWIENPAGCCWSILQGREDAASVHLQEYASQHGGPVRETWLDQSFSEDLLPAIMRCELPASARTEDIVALVCRWEEHLIGELGHLARECSTRSTSELLDNLARLEQARLTRLVYGAHQLDDL